MTILALSNGEWISIAAIAVIAIGALFTLIFKAGSLVRLIEGMVPDVKKIPVIESRVEELWRQKTTESNSPSRLNKNGQKILKESNISVILSPYYDEIVALVKKTEPSNAYKVQEALIDVLDSFKYREEILNDLEQSAFFAGTKIHTMLFVAAINMRDKVIKEIGFSVEEIDVHDPKNTKK